jgi:Predicted transcriptional regulators
MIYSIGETARRIGVNPSTLRYYDKEGLLPSVQRSSGGVRVFTENDFTWLRLIGCLKATGLPIKEIRQYIVWLQQGESTLVQRRDMFYKQKSAVEEQMAELQRALDAVTYKCWLYDKAVEAGSEEVIQNIDPADIPEDIRKLRTNSGVYQDVDGLS